MRREMIFDGWWDGYNEYSCDCCGRIVKIDFSDEAEAKDFKHQNEVLKARGWISLKVNGHWITVCSEACRDKYIRNNTI